jgi:hypothetical protein
VTLVQHAAEIVSTPGPVTDLAFSRAFNRKILGSGVRHEKDLCRCSDNAGICTVSRARSRACRRCCVRCLIGSSRFGAYRRPGRCCGRLHDGSLYCSVMGTEEIRGPSWERICKTIRQRSFRSASADAGSCHRRSGISPPPERDAACADIGMTPGVTAADSLRSPGRVELSRP